ncbi:20537_t:CDS:1, partial [Gigaspora rosea]
EVANKLTGENETNSLLKIIAVRGVNFSCNRCGLRVTNGIGYRDYETIEAYQADLTDGYRHLYCEADS